MERPFQEIAWNTAMVTIPAPHRSTTERARFTGSCTKALPVNVSSGTSIDGHEHAVLLLLCRCATPPTWPGPFP